MGIPSHGVFAVKKKARILVAVLVFILLGGAVVWAALIGFSNTRTRPLATGQPAQPQNNTLAQKIAAEASKDSDSDGLKDWEEAIWRTEPQKPDTDGDGTNDGEEIAQNRDPRKSGPNDKYVIAAETATESEEGKPSPENITAQLGATISADVLGSIAAGQKTDIKTLVSAYAENLDSAAVLERARVFSLRDLNPAPQNDLLTILKFFAAIEEVWNKNFKPGQPTDLEVFFSAFENGDPATVANQLRPYRRAYQSAIAAILKTPAPAEFQSFAVAFLNFLSKIDRSAELMQNFQTDPLAAMLAVRERLKLNEEFDAFIKRAIADSQGIVKKKVEELAAAQKQR